MDDFRQYIVPFCDDKAGGCGFFVGDYFVTAGHVFDEFDSRIFYFDGKYHTVEKKDALYLRSTKDHLNSEDVQDVAIFRFEGIGSPLRLNGATPYMGVDLTLYSFLVTTGELNPFSMIEVTGVVTRRIFHFFECEMNFILKEGSSGSPLIAGNQVYGILSGCWDSENYPEMIMFCSTKDLPIK